jgi:uncharacterized membrane protein YjgN (DUF898 family)
LDFEFTGKAGEYFGIWFVNGLLSSLTFGIYGPWAKVKRLQYFYSHTSLNNSPFQFLANPASMLVSRLIAIGLFVLFIFSEQFIGEFLAANVIYATLVLLYLLFAPIVFIMAASFRLRNSAWRNLRFGFNKDYWWAYRVYLAPLAVLGVLLVSLAVPFQLADTERTQYLQSQPVESTESAPDAAMADDESAEASEEEEIPLSDFMEPSHFIPAAISALLFILLIPYFDFIHTRFLAMNARFGTAEFTLTSTARHFYLVYSAPVVFIGLLAAVWFGYFYFDISGTGYFSLLLLLTTVFFSLIKSYFKAQRYNLVFNNLTLGDGHKIRAQIKTLRVFWLILVNTLAIILSFGFMRPWADIRVAGYFLANTQFEAAGSLDGFLAAVTKDESALAEELSDVFDLELG